MTLAFPTVPEAHAPKCPRCERVIRDYNNLQRINNQLAFLVDSYSRENRMLRLELEKRMQPDLPLVA